MISREFRLSDEFKSKLKLRLSAISGAFMLPIATMAIVSFFLSIGGTISGIDAQNAAGKIGAAFRSLAIPILQAFPILLCISFTIAFNKQDVGIAIWCSLLAFMTFIYFQSAFISFNDVKNLICCQGKDGCCCKNGGNCCVDGKGCCLLCCASKTKFTILFQAGGRDTPSLVTRLLGIPTLNTSIFGPMFIGGFLIPYIIKNYSNVKLPTYLAYFSGKRLLPLICSLSVIPLGLLTLVFWPWIGTALSHTGNFITKSEGGDSFLFGLFEKLLIPSGFHHIFASLFWYSPLGGDVSLALNKNGECIKDLCCKSANGSACTNCCVLDNAKLDANGALLQALSPSLFNSLSLEGDALIGVSALSLPGNKLNGSSKAVFEYLRDTGKIHAGKFTQGKFPIMQFALPAAALAIYLNARKRDKDAVKNIFPGIWNSFILGITEPIEFTFMHKFPRLFLFHSGMCGISFLSMRLAKAHIPTSFSGGFIELLINGVIPVQKGTQFWWWAAVGGGLALVYFSVFYYVFSKYDQSDAKHELKEEDKEAKESNLPPNIFFFKKGLGGWDNVANYKNCASRLRYDIKDKSKVDEASLKKAGVIAIKWIGDQHVQLIVGPKAEEINTNLLKYSQQEINAPP